MKNGAGNKPNQNEGTCSDECNITSRQMCHLSGKLFKGTAVAIFFILLSHPKNFALQKILYKNGDPVKFTGSPFN